MSQVVQWNAFWFCVSKTNVIQKYTLKNIIFFTKIYLQIGFVWDRNAAALWSNSVDVFLTSHSLISWIEQSFMRYTSHFCP